MKKLILVSLLSIACAACGGSKTSGPTTPSNNNGAMGSGATGGSSYGGAAGSGMSSGSAMAPSAGGDPCGG
jgi:hypothetical protein